MAQKTARRRSKFVFGFVKLPALDGVDIRSTGEGGTEFWLVAHSPGVPARTGGGVSLTRAPVRELCITGVEFALLHADVVCNGWLRELHDEAYRRRKSELPSPVTVNGAVCVGSTGLSLWDERRGMYWVPKLEDLDRIGQTVYHAFEELYGAENVELVTALDT